MKTDRVNDARAEQSDMVSQPLLNEEDLDLVVAYSLDGGEEMTEAVVDAFLAAGVDVFDRPTRLVDWIEADVLDHVAASGDQPVYLSTRIWDHQVVVTPGDVRIYRRPVDA